MANTSAAKKALRGSLAKELINKARKNRIRTFIRKVEDNIKNQQASEARESLKKLEKEIMRGVTKKVLKLGAASRKLRRLADSIRKINSKK